MNNRPRDVDMDADYSGLDTRRVNIDSRDSSGDTRAPTNNSVVSSALDAVHTDVG